MRCNIHYLSKNGVLGCCAVAQDPEQQKDGEEE